MTKASESGSGYTAPKGKATRSTGGADRSAINHANRMVTLQWVLVAAMIVAMVAGLLFVIGPNESTPANQRTPAVVGGGHG